MLACAGSSPVITALLFGKATCLLFLDSPDQGLPIVLFLESLYTKLNVLDQLRSFSQTLLVSLETPGIQKTLYQLHTLIIQLIQLLLSLL
jgi:hypothetical protein